MITYSKTAWGVHLFTRLYGSSALRCTPFPLLSAMLTALLWFYWKDKDTSWTSAYPYTVYSTILGFAIVFRNNYSYQRYWEGRTLLQGMTGRWADAFIQTFAMYGGREGDGRDRTEEFKECFLHYMSLLHAVAIQHLRGDWDLSNLHAMQPTDKPPPVDAAALKFCFFKPKKNGDFQRIGLSEYFLLSGTEAKRNRYNRSTPLGVIGGLSSLEGQLLGINMQKLGEPLVETAMFSTQTTNMHQAMQLFFGLSTGTYVPGAAERVQVVYSWVCQLLRQRIGEDKTLTPQPLATNLLHMLSEGLFNFENARKLHDTPFPFPWAQVVLLFLVTFAFTFPLLVVSFTSKLWLALIIDIIAVQSYFALNEVARDLEDPFVFEPNDLPMAFAQYQFNKRIQAGCASLRPSFYYKGQHCMEPENSLCHRSTPVPPKASTVNGS